jgi:hypothetical protein
MKKNLHPVLVGKTQETVSRLSDGPGSRKQRKMETIKRATTEYTKGGPGLLKYKASEKSSTLGPIEKKMNVGGTARNIVGLSRKESGMGRRKRVELAAKVTDKTKKQIRDIVPTKAGVATRKVGKAYKNFKKNILAAGFESAAVTSCGGSGKACKVRQGRKNF